MTTAAADIEAGRTEVAMEALLYFAVWAGLIFLMMRFGCGAHVMGHGHGNGKAQNKSGKAGDPELRWVPPKKDTDPVCGKTVATDKAKPSVHDGNVYYFCSRECREVFEAAPGQYIEGRDNDATARELEHSHV
jgi:YHS domain-containing protein